MERLKPCPFCGSRKLKIFINENRFKYNHIRCHQCGGEMRTCTELGERELYKKWNSRVK